MQDADTPTTDQDQLEAESRQTLRIGAALRELAELEL